MFTQLRPLRPDLRKRKAVALAFQTNYSARALFGFLGDDDFTVNFATNDGYVESDQSHFSGHYVP